MEICELAKRLDLVERQNRRLRGLVIAASLLAAAPFLTAGAPRATDSDRVTLRDGSGSIRAELSATSDGTSLSLRDGGGVERMVIGLASDGRPSLTLADAAGHLRARLIATRETSLNFYDERGKLRAALGVTGYGPRWLSPDAFESRSGADPGKQFFDPAALASAVNPLPADALLAEDGPVLKFYDATGKPRLEARVDVDRPLLFLHTSRGTLSIVRGEEVTPAAAETPPKTPPKAPR
ncbi:MAG: hypothetical protein QOD06_1195 [Candidatus Binatota bacterium]|nr:hypothetical protein [Candidatus Binatota bacterium]